MTNIIKTNLTNEKNVAYAILADEDYYCNPSITPKTKVAIAYLIYHLNDLARFESDYAAIDNLIQSIAPYPCNELPKYSLDLLCNDISRYKENAKEKSDISAVKEIEEALKNPNLQSIYYSENTLSIFLHDSLTRINIDFSSIIPVLYVTCKNVEIEFTYELSFNTNLKVVSENILR